MSEKIREKRLSSYFLSLAVFRAAPQQTKRLEEAKDKKEYKYLKGDLSTPTPLLHGSATPSSDASSSAL